jgi:bifunctional non-homologous end joining protein LigD
VEGEAPEGGGAPGAGDVLVDRMRGSSSLWYRVRINLEHVPAKLRPKEPKPKA